jgi:hypothetical protein
MIEFVEALSIERVRVRMFTAGLLLMVKKDKSMSGYIQTSIVLGSLLRERS